MNKLFLSLLMMAVTAGARIEWEQTEAVLRIHPTQASADAVFDFTNTGDTSVSFTDIKITCGCLVAKPLNPSYAPGEKGQLLITLNLKNRYGKQHKKIVAYTADGQKTELTISAEIPRAFTMKTPLVSWKKGDESTEKSITLRNPNALPIKLLSISSSNELLPAEFKTIREGFEYEVVVFRKPGAVNARAVIQLRAEPPPGLAESKAIKLYVSVR
jgi:hypothetical protein